MYKVREYHRPTDLEEAVHLLQRKDIRTAVLAGGVGLVGAGDPEIEALVDLDGVGLDFIEIQNAILHLGAMVRLQKLVDETGDFVDGLLVETARRMAGWHIRNAATLGGMIAGGDVHAPLSVALAALSARVKIYGESGEMPLWSELSTIARLTGMQGRLITALTINLPSGKIGASYQQVARTPADRPIVCVCGVVSESANGLECTVAVGGLLLDLDVHTQHVDKDAVAGVQEWMSQQVAKPRVPETTFQSDFLGGAEYRRSVAPVMVRRALSLALSRLGRLA